VCQAHFYGSWKKITNSSLFTEGACGFGEYGRTVNDGSVAGVSRLWRNGSGCGACYQVILMVLSNKKKKLLYLS